ncbi:MAG: UDP-galactose-lipid carrier transferase [Armatimonadetes bacterium]|nr:UDP-galactose-lipid carrier transferase [Armatimonadota bacterium]
MQYLDQVDLSKTIGNHEYENKLKDMQLELLKLERKIIDNRVPVIIAFEGWDAAGKGGAIKRMVDMLDPRGYDAHAISAPTADEKSLHYLRRFWLRLPRHGEIVIFDRTWYGRVLVERVEEFATKQEWQRAYDEINSFEKMVVDDGTVLIKFWMHISKEEQLLRFKDREKDPFKKWKITAEDYRNRERWDEYLAAAEEMFHRTDTEWAPWTIVEAECKTYARIKVITTVVESIQKALKHRPHK